MNLDLYSLDSLNGSIVRNHYRELEERTTQERVATQAAAKDFKEYMDAIRKLSGGKSHAHSADDFKRDLGKKKGI